MTKIKTKQLERNFEICKQMSREIYKATEDLPKNIDGWELIKTRDYGFVDENKNSKKRIRVKPNPDFCCAAYKKGNEIIISYQGTDIKKTLNPLELIDVITDCCFIMKKIPPSSRLAANFYNKIKKRYEGTDIYLTGHSLGGAYAQMVSARAIKNGESVKAITFNAPGVGYALSKKDKDKHKDNLLKNINNYVVINDFIGNFREHLGSTYYIQPFPLNIAKENENGCISPHSIITDYTQNIHGEIIKCPLGWNSKTSWALWVFDKTPVSKAEEKVRKLLDVKVGKEDLEIALNIIEDLKKNENFVLFNNFDFICRKKEYRLISNN